MISPENFEVLIKVVLPIIGSIIALFSFGCKVVKESHASKKNKLEGMKSIFDRQKEIGKSNKFIQDLEINTVSILKSFNWLEVEFILKRDIGIDTLANLRVLSKKQFVALDADKIMIPSRSYIFYKHILSIISWFLAINFLFSIVAIFYSLYFFPSGHAQNIMLFAYALFSEFFVIIRFDDLVSYNAIKKGNFEENKIYVSNDFKSSLKSYRNYRANYYSMERIKDASTSSDSQATS